MEHKVVVRKERRESVATKQAFLSSAISDISTYIQMADTKVSIIMAAVVTIIVGVLSCHDILLEVLSQMKPCGWFGVSLIILAILLIMSLVGVFAFGILTIWSHSSTVEYKSKWFLSQSTKEYSYDTYKKDVLSMSDIDIIENMTAELYKLNDINRQKAFTNKCTLICFSSSLLIAWCIFVLLILSTM